MYKSTRGAVLNYKKGGSGFFETLVGGLATDGGLWMPSEIPVVPTVTQETWGQLSYRDLCFAVLRCFVSNEDVSDVDLKHIIAMAYTKFALPECIALRSITAVWQKLVNDPALKPDFGTETEWTQGATHEAPVYWLELFHGPSYSFKDLALQLLARFFEYRLKALNAKNSGSRTHHTMLVLLATSGDTGSAAIEAFKDIVNLRCVVLFPLGKVSPIQALQMTTCTSPNIRVVAVQDASFDDCQTLVKQIMISPLQHKFNLVAANSINWARIMVQTVYYWYSALRVRQLENRGSDRPPVIMDVAVPTGNFGNILAAYYAKKMGAPIGNLIISTNANDILTRFWETGCYTPVPVIPTPAPSIDIQVASNFERLAYDFLNKDTKCVTECFSCYRAGTPSTPQKVPTFSVDSNALTAFRKDFWAYRCSTAELTTVLRRVYAEMVGSADANSHIFPDPHSAVALAAGVKYRQQHGTNTNNPLLVVATAHYAKFYDFLRTILPKEKVLERLDSKFPKSLYELPQKPTPETATCANQIEAVVAIIEEFLKDV